VDRQLHRFDNHLLPQHWGVGRRITCAEIGRAANK
jgi:hypothetical protein